ncbi:MAG: MFS transporter [bacterium]|nr:MFS transporter [bacterium]
MKKCKKLKGFTKGVLAGSPALTGAVLRWPFGTHIGKTGGKTGTIWLLVGACVGMALNTYLAFTVTLKTMEGWGADYILWCFGGLLSGCGVATFPMIINVLFWSEKKVVGHRQALYGGIGNAFPGTFALCLPFVIDAWGIDWAYVIWLCFLVIFSIVSIAGMLNPPFHQLQEQGVNEYDSRKIARWLGQEHIPKVSKTVIAAFGIGKAWVLSYVYFVCFGGFIALTMWLPVLNSDYHQTTTKVAGVFTAGYSILASICRPAMGKTTDNIGGGKATIMGLLFIMIGASIFMWCPPLSETHWT